MPSPRSQLVVLSSLLVTLLTLIALSRMGSSCTESQLRSIQHGLPYISYGDFFYNRPPRDYSGTGEVAKAWKQLSPLSSPDLPVGALVELSHHDDPNIRTLALLGLLAKESPEVIPVAIHLSSDGQTTFPSENSPSRRMGDHKIYTAPKTVASVAKELLVMLSAPYETEKRDTWWQARRNNPDWLGWYGFLYKRAYQGSSRPSSEGEANLRKLRLKVDALPQPLRSWVMLHLANDGGAFPNVFATEEEFVRSIKELGPDALLEFLRSGNCLGLNDPDPAKVPEDGNFLTRHADRFFTPAQAETLLQLKHFIAAADANPKLRRQAVDAAMKEFAGEYRERDRAKVMALLVTGADDSELVEVVKWFYEEPSSQTVFYGEIERRRPARWRDLVRLIVSHSDFEDLRSWDVAYLALLIPKLGGKKIIPDPTYQIDKKADLIRNQLRELFGLETTSLKILTTPQTLLSGPDWRVGLDDLADGMDLSPDGSELALTTLQGVVIHSASSGEVLHRLLKEGRNSSRATVAFSSDSRTLTYAPRNGLASVFDLSGPVPVEKPVAWSNLWVDLFPTQQSAFAVVMENGHLSARKMSDGAPIWRQTKRFVRPSSPVLSPDDSIIACCDELGKPISLFAAGDGRVLHQLRGHADPSQWMAFSPDSRLLISWGEDERVLIWDTQDGRLLHRYKGFGKVRFNQDGTGFFASPSSNVLAVYERATGEPRCGLKFFPDPQKPEIVEMKDPKTGRIFQAYKNYSLPESGWITDIALSPDGKHLFLQLFISTPVPGQFGFSKHTSRIERWTLP